MRYARCTCPPRCPASFGVTPARLIGTAATIALTVLAAGDKLLGARLTRKRVSEMDRNKLREIWQDTPWYVGTLAVLLVLALVIAR